MIPLEAQISAPRAERPSLPSVEGGDISVETAPNPTSEDAADDFSQLLMAPAQDVDVPTTAPLDDTASDQSSRTNNSSDPRLPPSSEREALPLTITAAASVEGSSQISAPPQRSVDQKDGANPLPIIADRSDSSAVQSAKHTLHPRLDMAGPYQPRIAEMEAPDDRYMANEGAPRLSPPASFSPPLPPSAPAVDPPLPTAQVSPNNLAVVAERDVPLQRLSTSPAPLFPGPPKQQGHFETGFTPNLAPKPTNANVAPFSDAGAPELGTFATEPIAARQTQTASTVATAPVTLDTRAVIYQVSAQIIKSESGKLDIRLDPPELGRLAVTISAGDDAITAVIAAERPETQDLLRRHADLLQRALREAGYDDVSLDFSGTANEKHGQNTPFANEAAGESAEPIPPAATTYPALAGLNGLDIRL